MKVVDIKQAEKRDVYIVHLKPNWLEKILGIEEKYVEYKYTYNKYVFTQISVYIDRKGNETGSSSSIAKAIDKYRRTLDW